VLDCCLICSKALSQQLLMVLVSLLQELASARKHMEENQDSKWSGAASTAMRASGLAPALCMLAYDACVLLDAE
jgi:hypothetical protein